MLYISYIFCCVYHIYFVVNIADDQKDGERNSQTREGTQAAIQRRKKPKRRSTGRVQVNIDVSIVLCCIWIRKLTLYFTNVYNYFWVPLVDVLSNMKVVAFFPYTLTETLMILANHIRNKNISLFQYDRSCRLAFPVHWDLARLSIPVHIAFYTLRHWIIYTVSERREESKMWITYRECPSGKVSASVMGIAWRNWKYIGSLFGCDKV